jgi:hypothetical protein
MERSRTEGHSKATQKKPLSFLMEPTIRNLELEISEKTFISSARTFFCADIFSWREPGEKKQSYCRRHFVLPTCANWEREISVGCSSAAFKHLKDSCNFEVLDMCDCIRSLYLWYLCAAVVDGGVDIGPRLKAYTHKGLCHGCRYIEFSLQWLYL